MRCFFHRFQGFGVGLMAHKIKYLASFVFGQVLDLFNDLSCIHEIQYGNILGFFKFPLIVHQATAPGVSCIKDGMRASPLATRLI